MTSAPSFVDGTVHEIVYVQTRNVGTTGTAQWYIDGVAYESAKTTSANDTSINNSGNLYVCGTNSARFDSTVLHTYIFNRALTAAEVLDLYRNGINYADKWGSQTNFMTNGTCESNVTGWSGITDGSGALAWDNTTGANGTSASAKRAVTGATYNYIYSPTFTIQYGKRYRASIWVKVDNTSNLYNDGNYILRVCDNSTLHMQTLTILRGPVSITSLTTDWQQIVAEFTANETATVLLYCRSVKSTSSNWTFWADEAEIYEIGATLALEPEGIQPAPGQWLDSSSNKLHALQPASGSSLTRYKKTGEVRWTNTWSGTHEAQYVGGVNQAVLPSDNIRVDSITMICTATGVNVILGDGSDGDRWVASVALATYLDCTVANRNHDGTNRKIVIDPDANYTGSITTIFKYTILD